MMTKPHDPVYPSEKMSGMNSGITLREHFAAMAMQGMLALSVNVTAEVAAESAVYMPTH